jgi:hypothetical protein
VKHERNFAWQGSKVRRYIKQEQQVGMSGRQNHRANLKSHPLIPINLLLKKNGGIGWVGSVGVDVWTTIGGIWVGQTAIHDLGGSNSDDSRNEDKKSQLKVEVA